MLLFKLFFFSFLVVFFLIFFFGGGDNYKQPDWPKILRIFVSLTFVMTNFHNSLLKYKI